MDQQHITEEEYETLLKELLGPVVSRDTEEMESINMGLFGGKPKDERSGFIWEDEQPETCYPNDAPEGVDVCRNCGAPATHPWNDCCIRCFEMANRSVKRVKHIWSR